MSASQVQLRPSAGLPPLDESAQQISFFEFWPPQLFYLPVALYWCWLSLRHRGPTLPTAANPGLPHGGLVGEAKSTVLGRFGVSAARWLARFTSLPRRTTPGTPELAARHAVQTMQAAALSFPIVAKPDMGCRGVGVKVVRGSDELADYLRASPPEADVFLQELVDEEGEVGIFYVRRPGEASGRVLSMTLKYFPYVVGDGRSTLRQLIERDPRAGRLTHLYFPRHADRLDQVVAAQQAVRLVFAGNHARGAIFRDGRAYVTPQLTAAIDAIARDIAGFYIGRFDIRFADFAALRRGEGFRIIEVNGAGSEATHIWDSRARLRDAYRDLFAQYRLMFEIGAENRRRGARPSRLVALLKDWRREARLARRYPPTD